MSGIYVSWHLMNMSTLVCSLVQQTGIGLHNYRSFLHWGPLAYNNRVQYPTASSSLTSFQALPPQLLFQLFELTSREAG